VLYWEYKMKTPMTAIITGIALSLALMLMGRQVDVAFCAIVLFGTGIVAWTLDQYYHQHKH
jgi:ABC-type enterobactin transport system permease subunit